MNNIIKIDYKTLRALKVLATIDCGNTPCKLCELFTPDLKGHCISSQASMILENIKKGV